MVKARAKLRREDEMKREVYQKNLGIIARLQEKYGIRKDDMLVLLGTIREIRSQDPQSEKAVESLRILSRLSIRYCISDEDVQAIVLAVGQVDKLKPLVSPE